MENKYNLKSPGATEKIHSEWRTLSRGSFSCQPAVKRLMKEAAELRHPTEHYHAQPLEDNLFEWHFSVRGPPDSDFDGGVYHGRIVLPPEYPMKPPSIILLTPNGRFEVGKKICLSISGHHPETWQPSWSIRTALIAIIGFMPTKGEGAIGSLDYNPEERRGLAKKSQDFCCETCGCSLRSALLGPSPTNPSPDDQEDQELAQQINFKAEARQASESTGAESEPPTDPRGERSTSGGQEEEETHAEQAEAAPAASEDEPCPTAPSSRSLSPRQRRAQQHQREPPSRPTFPAFPHTATPHPPQDASHTGSVVLIMVLALLLAALIFRRIYLTNEYKFDYEL
ncbi:ubiquitin-conjugating enzyme E2 J1 isoform X2 [Oncorhynchus tshawytscha]|uniref:ubiquitin-conjugating enzyme E2 J1 isoform X2 n=1 Tax=Oncorhynchus tshawytscha TaxID=74940 RepID=UPI000D09E477|nr:ubiquitin-conjugating enzyme E2 J1 isoform X2 [Oncorhynchus tshawytscha]